MWKDTRVHAGLLTVGLIYGANYSIAKYVMPEFVSPFALILIRVGCATVFFALLVPFMAPVRVHRSDWPRLAACAFSGVALNQLLFFKGLSLTSPIHASVLMLVTPILVLLGASVVLKERVAWVRWLGIALGILGAGFLVTSAGRSDAAASVAGDVMVFINAASYAAYLIMVKPLLQRYSALTISLWTFALGLPMVLPFGLPELLATDFSAWPSSAFASAAFIVIAVTIVAYLLSAWTMRSVSPATVGAYIYLQPVFAASIALALGQDSLSWQKIASMLLVGLGVYLAQNRQKQKKSAS